MKAWIATALLILLAVPHQTFWQDYETARRGLLAVLCGFLCLFPGTIPRRVPLAVWPVHALALWLLARAMFDVTNRGYALETAAHYLAIAVLVLIGTGLSVRAVTIAAIPTGFIVAGVTLAQAHGFLLPGVPAVTSTLGNLNVASEVLTICGAGTALYLVRDAFEPGRADRWLRPLAVVALFLCGVAVVINGSRSGLVALPLGCALALLAGRGRPLVLFALLAGMGGGVFVPAPQPPPAASQAPDLHPTRGAPSTIEVRLELWKGGLQMAAARPLIGHGGGQFQNEYPRFRTDAELDLSTFHRAFLSAPGTTHNDYLQLLIEGGPLALLALFLAAGFVLRRAPPSHWGPLLAFGALAFVRAPILNAPVVAFVALFAGCLLGRFRRDGEREISFAPTRQIVKGLVFGAVMLWFGAAQLGSQVVGAGMLERLAADRDPDGQLRAVESALRFRPWDHNFLSLRAQARLQMNDLDAAERDIVRLQALRPHDRLVKWLHVELLRARGRHRDAIQALEQLRIEDPYDPKAIIWTAEIFVQLRQSPAAIVFLYSNPQVRDRLATILRDLANFADVRGDRADAAVLRTEQAFLATVDALQAGRAAAALTHWKRFGSLLLSTDEGGGDLRPIALGAAIYLALGKKQNAIDLAVVGRTRRPLPKTHLELLTPVTKELRELPAWRELLR